MHAASITIVMHRLSQPPSHVILYEHLFRHGILTVLRRLKMARRNQIFANVLRRKEHHHARCTQSASFSSRFSRGFLTKAEQAEWEAKRAAHQKKYLDWRAKEEILLARARNEPHKVCVIRIDDTEAVKLPHPGNRIPKDLCGKDGPEVHHAYLPDFCSRSVDY